MIWNENHRQSQWSSLCATAVVRAVSNQQLWKGYIQSFCFAFSVKVRATVRIKNMDFPVGCSSTVVKAMLESRLIEMILNFDYNYGYGDEDSYHLLFFICHFSFWHIGYGDEDSYHLLFFICHFSFFIFHFDILVMGMRTHFIFHLIT